MKNYIIRFGWLPLLASASALAAGPAVEKVNVDALKQKYWETGEQSEIRVVQNRLYKKAGKLEFGAFAGSVSTDAFLSVKSTGGLARFFFTERWGMGVVGWKSFASDSVAQVFLRRHKQTEAVTNPPESFYGAEALYSPIYGKLSLFGKLIIHYDVHATAGAGLTDTQNGRYLTPFVGVGQQVYLNKHFAMRLDYRFMRYNEVLQTDAGPDPRANNTNAVSFGLTAFLGSGW